MTDRNGKAAPAWAARFLDALRAGHGVRAACREAGIGNSAAYHLRDRNDAFRAAWDAIPVVDDRRKPRPPVKSARDAAKIERFLEELAASSNVAQAASVADLASGKIYKLRREDPDFARRWQEALAEGYDNLEMELLAHLRGNEKSGTDTADADAPRRKFDVATALRCLTAHRESVAREKGRRTLEDEVATIAAINARIDLMRLRAQEGGKAIRQARKDAAKRAGDGEG